MWPDAPTIWMKFSPKSEICLQLQLTTDSEFGRFWPFRMQRCSEWPGVARLYAARFCREGLTLWPCPCANANSRTFGGCLAEFCSFFQFFLPFLSSFQAERKKVGQIFHRCSLVLWRESFSETAQAKGWGWRIINMGMKMRGVLEVASSHHVGRLIRVLWTSPFVVGWMPLIWCDMRCDIDASNSV